MHHAILSMQGIYKSFIQGNEKTIVLDGIDSHFIQNKSYAITGISGAGKSTFMHILAGLDAPTAGTVYFNDLSIYTLSPSAHAQFLNKSIGLVFQSPYLVKELSVLENIILPGLINGYTRIDCTQRAEQLLQKINLYEKKDQKPGELSGGQQQRIAIARAIFNEPTFLIADEPTSNVDITTGKTILELLLSCHQEWGMGLIISSHDQYVTERMDEVYTLHQGKLIK